MTHLIKRLDRIEAQFNGDAGVKPSVVLIAEPNGEVMAALCMDGSNASRREGESEAAFIDRVEIMKA